MMIDLKNVSMKFNLEIEKDNSLKLIFIRLFDPKKRKKKVKKIDDEFWALKDVTFSIGKGDVVGIIGANGAGKSTLLKIIAGVYKPTKGQVIVNGKVSPMIELGAGFDNELTGRENIFLNGAILGYSKDFIEKKLNEIIKFSELEDFIDVPVKNYSSGMFAKLAFSISTIVSPEILIVDEILSVGDISFQKKSEQKMLSMIKDRGTTVVYVSHSMDSIKKICNKVIWLDHGEIQAFGKTKDVCKMYVDHQLNN